MIARTPRLAAGFVLSALFLILTALPAAALDDGEEPGASLSLGAGILLFVGVPLVVMGLVAVPIAASASRRRNRYRPSEGWGHEPMWFAGPEDPESAVRSASPDQPGRGGASAGW